MLLLFLATFGFDNFEAGILRTAMPGIPGIMGTMYTNFSRIGVRLFKYLYYFWLWYLYHRIYVAIFCFWSVIEIFDTIKAFWDKMQKTIYHCFAMKTHQKLNFQEQVDNLSHSKKCAHSHGDFAHPAYCVLGGET